MKGLLDKLLQKKGIESIDELSKDEKKIFDDYDRVLSKEVLTSEDIKRFIETQIVVIENKWKDLDVDNIKKAELIPHHTVYKTILRAIDAPLAEKKALEDYLRQQI